MIALDAAAVARRLQPCRRTRDPTRRLIMQRTYAILRGTAAGALACLLGACATNEVEKPMTNAGETMHFKNLDRSGDGLITSDELPVDHELFVRFGNYDLDSNGEISEYEFGEYIAQLPD
jgi:hypothetical protein